MYEAGTAGDNWQLALKSTNLLTAAGHHELRYGVQFEDIDFTIVATAPDRSFTFPNGVQSRTGVSVNVVSDPVFGRIYQAFGTLGDPPVIDPELPELVRPGLLEDRPPLTLRPGIRWERAAARRVASRSATRTSRSWAPVTAPPATRSTARTPGATTGAPAWAPSSTSPARAGRGSTRAGAASTPRSPTTWPVRAMSDGADSASADYFDAELTQPVPDGVAGPAPDRPFPGLRRAPGAVRERLTIDLQRRARSRASRSRRRRP